MLAFDACSIPKWLPHLVGLASTIALAVPAFRVDSRLRKSQETKDELEARPKNKLARLRLRWARGLKDIANEWNHVDSRFFRSGVLLAIVAGAMGLFESFCVR
jgi:hypothetical protein